MPVAIPNFEYSYLRKGKPVFVPTGIGRRIGSEIKSEVEGAYEFDPIYFHLRRGGHVAAMHCHRQHRWFARIDISRFFYSISRRRVQSALDRVGVANAAFFAKWSTVSNPYDDPKWALPYGFVQSPILASLVLATSAVGDHIISLPRSILPAIYMDDISLSSNDRSGLQDAFERTLAVLEKDGFAASAEKMRPPASTIDIFNCDLTQGRCNVRDERIAAFRDAVPDPVAHEAFQAYCDTVERGNRP